MTGEQKTDKEPGLRETLPLVRDPHLRHTLAFGIGMHHAGGKLPRFSPGGGFHSANQGIPLPAIVRAVRKSIRADA